MIYTGTFTNNGAYISDPAIQRFDNLLVGQTGYLKGGLADFFLIGGNFVNYSTMNTDWNTSLAYLGFVDGTSALHDLYLTGANSGATLSGYKDNFSWGVLDLIGDYLKLYDGNDVVGGALYAGGLWGASDHGPPRHQYHRHGRVGHLLPGDISRGTNTSTGGRMTSPGAGI